MKTDTQVITAKVQIFPNKQQVIELKQMFELYSLACNWLSKKVFQNKILNQVKLHHLVYDQMRSELGTKAQFTQSVIKTVVARYKSLKSNGHDWSLVKFSGNDYDLVWNRDYSLVGNQFSVGVSSGRIKVNFAKKPLSKFQKAKVKFGSAKMVNKFGKWFLHIPLSKEVPALTIDEVSNVVGVDLGINHLATTYDSKGKTDFYRGGTVKHKRGVFKAIRKSLQEKQTSSARHRLKQIGNRENRYMTDVNHQITKALTQKHPKGTVFVLEDLTGVRQATEKVRLKNRYVSVSWAFYQFKQLLCYKAKENGQSVIVIDPKYTSQTCPKCGHREKANRDKKKHHFHCKRCHYQSNDDRIGAMNIHRKGIEFVSQSDPSMVIEQASIAKVEVNQPDIPTA